MIIFLKSAYIDFSSICKRKTAKKWKKIRHMTYCDKFSALKSDLLILQSKV